MPGNFYFWAFLFIFVFLNQIKTDEYTHRQNRKTKSHQDNDGHSGQRLRKRKYYDTT